MKALLCLTLVAVATLGGLSRMQSAAKNTSDKERFIGAWHLVSLGEQGADGKVNSGTDVKGMLVYTRDGHMSVQLMQPESGAALSNDYFLNGYEASFGRYEVDEAKHTVTHHVQGSITHGLVGKDLPRAYQFSEDGKLIIKSTRPEEHWLVTWEHY